MAKKDEHPVRKEIRGIIFLLVTIVLGGSLLSYHPSDKLIWNVTGPLGDPSNLFGIFGSHLAGFLYFLLGFSSLWLAIFSLVPGILAFHGRPFSTPIKSVFASLLLLLSSSALLSLRLSGGIRFRGSSIEAGGLSGLILSDYLAGFLNHFGAYALLIAIFIVSFMAATRFSIGWLLSKFGLWALNLYRYVKDIITKRRERKKRALKTKVARNKIKSKPKVTIREPAPKPEKRPEQEPFSFMHLEGEFKLPPLDLLDDPSGSEDVRIHQDSLEMNARLLEKKLEDFGVHGEVTEILPGPVITMYEYRPAPGIKISKVAGLADDLALTLRAPSIRVVAPIPGKAAIGIEIPNNQREMVYLKELLTSSSYKDSKYRLPIALGKDITGEPVVTDLTRMPHLLVAGATGTGKSVCINAMMESLLFKMSPDAVRFLVIDPKRIELSIYHDIPHLLHPVVIKAKDATKALRWAVEEMERRYMLLSDRGFRNLETYNRRILKDKKAKTSGDSQTSDKPLPYIVVVIDELVDLMMASSKDVEESITRLAQMARAAGIHLIVATQRPSVDVLTGLIKANFSTRISFQVSSKVDSRTILDTIGAENLLGEGDMLFMPPGVARIMRIHGAYVSEEEVKKVTDYLRKQGMPEYDDTVITEISRDETLDDEDIELDDKYQEAVEVVFQTGQASISMIQRKLRVGYNRAARMIEAMEKEGIVGPSDGVRPRNVYARKEL